jgi:hypothetical protein
MGNPTVETSAGMGSGVTYADQGVVELGGTLGLDILIGRSGILKPYGFLDVGLRNGAIGGRFMAGCTILF